ncbi:MAG: class I SAM-dependent methyltransferase, partial [Anaerolineae bacterium]
MTAWHEDDVFWEAWAPQMFTEQRWEMASEEVDAVIQLLDLSPGAHVLDLCCGPGRHSLELARRGFRITGVDRTPAYLDQARRLATEEGLEVEFVQADMRDFRRPETFDGAVNLFTAFGYFEDPAEDLQVVQNLHASLKPGGRLVMEMMGKEVLARIFLESNWQETDDGVLVLEKRKIRSGWDWIDNRWIIIDGEERREFAVGHRLYSGAELAALLRQAGFDSVELYGALAGGP